MQILAGLASASSGPTFYVPTLGYNGSISTVYVYYHRRHRHHHHHHH
jgi:membrane associated rhomboid family serine protease